MRKRDIKRLQKVLLKEREHLMQMVKKNREGENEFMDVVGDSADMAYDCIERELLFDLNDKERARLENINHALKKIEKDRFGVCEDCGKKISDSRLKAIPFARFCIECKSAFEKPIR